MAGVLRRHAPLWLILILFAADAVAGMLIFPPWDLPDEDAHFHYAQWMNRHGGIPPLSPGRDIRNEADGVRVANNPPLYYLLVAPLVGSDLPSIKGRVQNHEDRIGTYFAGSAELGGTYASRMYACRAVGILLGAIGIVALYAAGRRLFPDNVWAAVLPAALFGLNPKVVQFAGAVNPEILGSVLAAALTGLGIYRVTSDKGERWVPWALGALCGLGLLARVSAIAMVGFLTALLVFEAVRSGLSRRLVRDAGALGFTAFLVAGWWYGRNWLLYGDPFGVESVVTNWNSARGAPSVLGSMVPADLLALASRSFESGWAGAWLLGLAGCVGFVLWGVRFRRDRAARVTMVPTGILFGACLACCLVSAVLVGSYFVRTSHMQGRYLLVAAAPLGLFAAMGLLHLFQRRARPLALAAVILLQGVNVAALVKHYRNHRMGGTPVALVAEIR